MVTVSETFILKRVKYEWCLVFFVQQEDDDTDPLDAFMADVNKEVKYLNYFLLDSTNSNLVILNSALLQTQIHVPWICPSVVDYLLLQTPAISKYFLFPLRG